MMRVWIPAVRAGTGADVFTRRLAEALGRYGVDAVIHWSTLGAEILGELGPGLTPPRSATVAHLNARFPHMMHQGELPAVVTLHACTELPCFDRHKSVATAAYHRWLVRPRVERAIRRAEITTAVSGYVAQACAAAYGVATPRIISNWIDVDYYQPVERVSGGTRPRLFFSGRPGWAKGSDYLPLLARAVSRQGVQLVCTLDRAQWPGIVPENVVLTGRLGPDALRNQLQSASALVMPSRSEGFGLSAVEAMACGIPVLGFTGTGMDDFVLNGRTGHLAEQGGVVELADTLAKWLENPVLHREVGQAARELVVQKYTEASVIPQYIEAYEAAVRAR